MKRMGWELFNLIKSNKSVLIISHRRADIDAVASAILVKNMTERLGWGNIDLVFPEGISNQTLEIIENIDIDFEYYLTPPRHEYELTIVLDTSSEKLLGNEWRKISKKKVVWVDHHVIHTDEDERDLRYIDSRASSTVEIVLDIYSFYYPINSLPRKTLLLAAIAIYLETRFLQIASVRALTWFTKIIDILNVRPGELLKYISKKERNKPEKIAILKGIARSWAWKLGEKYVSITFSSSYSNKISKQLINLGFDIAIVLSHKKRGKIHIRSREEASDILEKLVEKLVKKIENIVGEVSHGGHQTIYNIEFNKIEKNRLKMMVEESIRETAREMDLKLSEIK